jgi:SAM-dependent methyltransferase
MKALHGGRLAFFDKAATPAFWEEHWRESSAEVTVQIQQGVPGHLLRAMRRWVPPGSYCLEAGCGSGNIVYGLTRAGWPCVGVDFSQATVRTLQRSGVDLCVCCGDVRASPFRDRTFDCYISQGVIEHLVDGYMPVLREMDRVLKAGGTAVVSFPSLNAVRRVKLWLRQYDHFGQEDSKLEFYQYALDANEVSLDLRNLGYTILEVVPYEGLLGIADDIFYPFDRFLRRLYNVRTSHLASGARRVLEPVLSGWAGYCSQIVARKNSDGKATASG